VVNKYVVAGDEHHTYEIFLAVASWFTVFKHKKTQERAFFGHL
jgi:hypothetical protein